MVDPFNPDTSITLLMKVRLDPIDQGAWDSFVDRYGRLVYRWCRTWGLQPADAEDVAQNVLLDLAQQMREFDYEPPKSFRAWLKTIAYRSWCRFVEHRRHWRQPSRESDFE